VGCKKLLSDQGVANRLSPSSPISEYTGRSAPHRYKYVHALLRISESQAINRIKGNSTIRDNMTREDENLQNQNQTEDEKTTGTSKWSLIITWAPIILATCAFGLSLWTYFDNRDFQRKAASVDAMKEHLNLSIDHVENTVSPWEREDISTTRAAISDNEYKKLETDEEKEYVWFASHALFTAETIYNWQVGDNTMWEDVDVEKKENPWLVAAAQFVGDHWTYIRWDYTYNGGDRSSVCIQYSKGFISFMKEVSGVTDLCSNVS
jgi:hypothetical protein